MNFLWDLHLIPWEVCRSALCSTSRMVGRGTQKSTRTKFLHPLLTAKWLVLQVHILWNPLRLILVILVVCRASLVPVPRPEVLPAFKPLYSPAEWRNIYYVQEETKLRVGMALPSHVLLGFLIQTPCLFYWCLYLPWSPGRKQSLEKQDHQGLHVIQDISPRKSSCYWCLGV